MHKLPHLYKNRFGVYYLRVYCSGHERKKSLGTKNFSEAKITALIFNLELTMSKPKLSDFSFSDASKFGLRLPSGVELTDIKSDADVRRAKELLKDQNLAKLAALAGGAAKNKIVGGKKFSEVVAEYIVEKKHDNKTKTIADKTSSFDQFKEWFGDKLIEGIGDDEAGSYKSRLLGAGFSATRINTKLSFFFDLFEYARQNKKYFGANPFASLRISSRSKLKQQSESYEPFTDAELKNIFDPANYGFLKKPDYYWLPLLALFSGARVEELASLRIDQIKKQDGIWFFNIITAKNKNSVRKIPLHQEILGTQFLAYVESVKAKKQEMLFPHLKGGKNGYGKNTSRRFGQYLDKLGIKSPLKVFHSFRHTFITRLSEHHIHPAVLMSIVGHTDQAKVDLSAPHFSTYQHEKPLLTLKRNIDKLEFPKLNISM